MPSEGAQISFGVPEMPSIGIIQSDNVSESAEIAEARGPDGKVIEQRAYSKTEEHQIEALFQEGTEPPKIGQVVDVAATETEPGWRGIVKSRSKNKTNTDYVKLSLTIERKDQAELVAYDDGAGEVTP